MKAGSGAKRPIAWAMLTGTVLAALGCARPSGVTGAALTAAGETATAEHLPAAPAVLEQAMLEILESLSSAGPAALGDAVELETGRADAGRSESIRPLERVWIAVERAVLGPFARPLSAALSRACRGPSARVNREPDHLAQLRQQAWRLQQQVQEIERLAGPDRVACQGAWGQAQPRLRSLAERIVDAGPAAADAYGPVLSALLRQVETLGGKRLDYPAR